MEDELDAISRGETDRVGYLRQFYFGDGTPGLKGQLEHKAEAIDAREVGRVLIGQPSGESPVFVRVGRYGPYLEQGERRASLPEEIAPDELTLARAAELLGQAAQAEEPLGTCPGTGQSVYLKTGRFGPYVQRGTPDGDEKPKNASLLKGMQPADVTLEVALQLLSLPRDLGADPASGQPVVAHNGRFGPYVKCGDETRSLPAGVSPIQVTLGEALALLAQPKAARRGFGAKREPLKVFDPSPVTGQPVQLLEGRYGLYLADGVTNASLPKGMTVDELTPQAALELLAARAAQGPSPRGARRSARRVKASSPRSAAQNTQKPAAKRRPTKRKTAKRA
jgi:DNA topoisomerase-1